MPHHETFLPKIIGPTVEARRMTGIHIDPVYGNMTVSFQYGTDEAGEFAPNTSVPEEKAKYLTHEVLSVDDQSILDSLLDKIQAHHLTQYPA